MSTTQTLRTAGISAARDYQELPAWQKSIALAESVFGLTEHFPIREHAGLAAEMRRTALDIAASIAAASGRNNEFGMTDSYSKAQSSTAELATQGILATRLDYIDSVVAQKLVEQIEEVSRLIVALKHGLKVAAKDAERAERDAKAAEREIEQERKERERPRREFKPREDRGDRPRRDFKSRDGEDRPRREYKPREDRGERKPYGEKKSYGDKKPYGDRKPYGDKKPYGEKKSFGDRKPRGDKPFRKPRRDD